MAERRMFAKTIVLSDAFLDMPMSARCLYFTLGMLADDDGFVNSPKSIMRQVGASIDDMNIRVVTHPDQKVSDEEEQRRVTEKVTAALKKPVTE